MGLSSDQKEGKFQSQTNAFCLPAAQKVPTDRHRQHLCNTYSCRVLHLATQLIVKTDKEKSLQKSTKGAVSSIYYSKGKVVTVQKTTLNVS